MTAPLTAPGRWIPDQRGQGRGVRVSAHAEAGVLVLSTWRAGVCVGTVRLSPDEAGDLVEGLVDGLARLEDAPPYGALPDSVPNRALPDGRLTVRQPPS